MFNVLLFSLWRRHPDLNWGIKVLQTSALPLGYVAGLARVAGFEPAHDGIRIHCLTAWRYPNAYLYCLTCLQMGWIVGFEPTHNGATTRCLNHLTIPTILEATPGFEPGNKGFADLCLTTWLCRLKELVPLNKNWRSGTGSNRRPPA